MRAPRTALLLLALWLPVAAAPPAGGPVAEAQALRKSGHPEEALARLREALAKAPDDVSLNAALAEMLLELEHFEEADTVINNALKIYPNSPVLYNVRGDIVFREGQVFEAEKEYRAAFKVDSHSAHAIFGIGRAFQMAALRAKANQLIKTAAELNPKDPRIAEAKASLDTDPAGRIARLQEQLRQVEDRTTVESRQLADALAIAKELNGRHSCELASPYRAYQATLVPLMNGNHEYGVSLKVNVNGVKTELEVDTGANGIILNPRLAEAAGVKKLTDSEIRGIGTEGALPSWIGFAEHVQVGDLEFRNCVVRVADMRRAGAAQALIGPQVFKRFLVKLGFRAHRLELDPLPGPAWDGWTPVDRYNGPELEGFDQFLQQAHDILIPTGVSESQNGEQTPTLFLLDTGAGGDLISTNLAPDITKMRDSDGRGIRGFSGKVKMTYRADQVVLQFSRFRKRIPNLMAIDFTSISRSVGIEVSGILGMPVLMQFDAITLDYRDGRVKFDYKR